MDNAIATLGLVALLVVSGCTGPIGAANGPAGPDDGLSWTPCEHPWPCGDGTEWPVGLEGPFEPGPFSFETVKAEDGVAIRGWVQRPQVPDGVAVPVVLIPSPYWGTLMPSPELWPSYFETPETDMLMEALVRAGYAVAGFSSRGTGVSGGCLPWMHAIEGRDMALVADWLGEQPWSNGRVGATGISYEGFLNWAMAVDKPAALKTIVPLAAVSPTLYTHLHTPQGAAVTPKWPYAWLYDAAVTAHGTDGTQAVLDGLAERECATTTERIQHHLTSKLTDQRDRGFYEARDVGTRLGEITAAVWIVHAFNDYGPLGGGHAMDDDILWDAIAQVPRAMSIGRQGHLDPARGEPGFIVHTLDAGRVAAWHAELLSWYDFWLKGIGEGERVGSVSFQLGDGNPLTASAWPPAQASDEVLYLADGALATSPREAATRYVSLPQAAVPSLGYALQETGQDGRWGPLSAACAPSGTGADGVAFVSAPLSQDTLLAGNPMASLLVSADEPRAVVSAYLLDIGPQGTCEPRFISFGAANLAVHSSPFEPAGFPMNEPTPVRIDMNSAATRVPAGHRIAVVVGAGDPGDVGVRVDRVAPITIVGDGTALSSHIVVPIVEGTTGGQAPSLTYPLRPFTSPWYDLVDPYGSGQ